jgi:hypothetical protein
VEPNAGVRFDGETDPPRLVVTDTVGGRQSTFLTGGPVDPTPTDPEAPVPVERAVTVETDRLVTTQPNGLHVRDGSGGYVASVGIGGADRFDARGDPAPRYLELETAVKTYLRVETGVAVDRTDDRTRIAFDRPTTVRVYARVQRRQPTHEVTLREDPRDLMRALSLFGTAVQTTTPERTYPTLRGHPPELAVGQAFDADGLSPPDTGVTVETPPRLETTVPVAPLAYYLGAEIVPGDAFAVRTDAGVVHDTDLADADGVARAARRTLERVFTLECAVRTAGLYAYEFEPTRALASVVESHLGVGPEAVYDASPARRVAMAFELPYEPLAEQAPTWPRVGCVDPVWTSVPALSSLVDTLAPIRAVDPPRVAGARAAGRIVTLSGRAVRGGRTRSVSRVVAGDDRYADLTEFDPDADADVGTVSRRRTWVGRDIPLGANQHLRAAAANRRCAASDPTEPPMEVLVVSNEARMDTELGEVRSLYGDRDDLPIDVSVHRRVDRRSFRALLQTDVDFLHYVGHATPEGLQCPGGRTLDLGSLSETGVSAFCLNACQSYTQGRRLIEAGALGGVVTHGNVGEGVAHRVGATLARLLNNGYPLGAALDVAGSAHPAGAQYAVLGGETASVVQGSSGFPCLWDVSPIEPGFEVTVFAFAGRSRPGVGSYLELNPEPGGIAHLTPNTVASFETSHEELRAVATGPLPPPFLVDGAVRWGLDAIETLEER